jgi:4,5-dihydroxyphthalate decarboxylase
MQMLKLTVGLTRDPRIEPLADGTVKPQNIELEFVFSSPGEIHYRNLKYDEFDLFQMSISEFLMARERITGTKWQWSALPVFLSKAFVWLNLFANGQSGISNLGDLKGKRVGVPDYPMTAALWMRIFLKELYGIKPQDILWYNGRTKEFSHAVILDLDKNPPPGVNIRWLTDEQTLDVMLDRAELDAAYGFPARYSGDFGQIDRYGGTPTIGNPRLSKVFPDGGEQITKDYFKKSGVLPSNHLFALQDRVLTANPWVPLELYKAFQRSKEVAYERAKQSVSAYLLFSARDFKTQAEFFGEDPYPLGIKKNRRMLEILFRGSYEDGLTKKLARIEDIFCPSTLDT